MAEGQSSRTRIVRELIEEEIQGQPPRRQVAQVQPRRREVPLEIEGQRFSPRSPERGQPAEAFAGRPMAAVRAQPPVGVVRPQRRAAMGPDVNRILDEVNVVMGDLREVRDRILGGEPLPGPAMHYQSPPRPAPYEPAPQRQTPESPRSWGTPTSDQSTPTRGWSPADTVIEAGTPGSSPRGVRTPSPRVLFPQQDEDRLTPSSPPSWARHTPTSPQSIPSSWLSTPSTPSSLDSWATAPSSPGPRSPSPRRSPGSPWSSPPASPVDLERRMNEMAERLTRLEQALRPGGGMQRDQFPQDIREQLNQTQERVNRGIRRLQNVIEQAAERRRTF